MSQDINTSRQNTEQQLGDRFGDAIRANQAATDQFDETLTQFLGISRTDGRCLDIIDRRGRVSAGQLANESGLTTGGVTAVVDRLEAAGYIRRIRDQLDRRKIWLEPTEAMRQLNDRIFGHYARTGPEMMARFTPEQLKGILEFLAIGTLLNEEMAAALREQTDASATTLPARLQQAEAFERAVAAGADRRSADLRTIDVKLDDFS